MSAIKILLTVLSTQILPTTAILLDIHTPLPQGCLLTQALKANLALRQISRPPLTKDDSSSNNDSWEGVDLFTRHTPHITLYLADFDLEDESQNTTAPTALNQTKVTSFLNTINSLNFTTINKSSCPLSFTAETDTTDSFFSINNEKYYVINGAYTMIPVKNNACLQHLSDSLLEPLHKFLKLPSDIPSWVEDLPFEEKTDKISKITSYGSPNVLDSFEPHVTVGYDEYNYHRKLQSCPDGQCQDLQGECQTVVSCFADPCTEVPGEKCSEGEVCQTNFCGGCNFECVSLLIRDSGREESQLRVNAMDEWNGEFQTISGECNSNVAGVAVGKTGLGGTVLSDSRLEYWELIDDEDDTLVAEDKVQSIYARVQE
jgi:hypothetical protein